MLSTAIAETKRDAGIERAADHAERETPGWIEQASQFLRGYARTHVDFLAEDVVAAALFQIPPPPDGRAWGAVFRQAAREGVIHKVGYAPAKTSNLSPKVLWESRVLDRTAPLDHCEWAKLARNYVRFFRQTVKRGDFMALELQEHAARYGCPAPQLFHWWDDVLRAEGLEQADGGVWRVPEQCCPECTLHAKEHW